ncbi:hypothetical protein Q3G72_016852 [Acer saccharum]|nr:hypothetical protein Q3G72_016852 [Acer saccharum]
MLPEGIGEIRYRDMFAEALRFFMHKAMTLNILCCGEKYNTKSEACNDLLKENFGAAEEAIKGDKSQSLLFYGCRLANQLKSLQIDHKWEVTSEVWVEMLTYASNKCRWKEHGQQLRKGGELLTHVHLLMVHLGLSEQYRIQNIKFDEENMEYLKLNCFLVCMSIVGCLCKIILCFARYVKKRDTSQV